MVVAQSLVNSISRNRRKWFFGFLLVTTFSMAVWSKALKTQLSLTADTLVFQSPVPTRTPTSLPVVSKAAKQHVYYLKIHKAASSTLYAILSEYSRSHGLLPLLPQSEHINLEPPLLPKKQLMLSPQIQHYDMVFNHHVYDPAIFHYLHNDTFKFTMLREPFKHFVSSVTYFRHERPYLRVMEKYPDPVTKFLEQRNVFEVTGFESYTNNRQSVDLGYEILNVSFSDESYLQNFIKLTEERFDLMLITEYFLESIVVLKRALKWQTQDILYFVKNALPDSQLAPLKITEWHRERHRNFSQPDIKLYEHFLSLFKQRMSQTVGLQGEVSELKDILTKVKDFCNARTGELSTKLEIPAGRWSESVSLPREKCRWLMIDELSMTKHLQKLQRAKFHRNLASKPKVQLTTKQRKGSKNVLKLNKFLFSL